jgi:hypothetical protein
MWTSLIIRLCAPRQNRLDALPPSVRHVVVIPTVPVVFPKLPLSEQALSAIESSGLLKGALQKTGLAAGILDKCGFHLVLSPTLSASVSHCATPVVCQLARFHSTIGHQPVSCIPPFPSSLIPQPCGLSPHACMQIRARQPAG